MLERLTPLDHLLEEEVKGSSSFFSPPLCSFALLASDHTSTSVSQAAVFRSIGPRSKGAPRRAAGEPTSSNSAWAGDDDRCLPSRERKEKQGGKRVGLTSLQVWMDRRTKNEIDWKNTAALYSIHAFSELIVKP